MSTIKPFTIDVPQPKLDDLRARLARTIWPSNIPGQSYGDRPWRKCRSWQ